MHSASRIDRISTGPNAPHGGGVGNIIAILFVLIVASLAACATLQQVKESAWEKAAIASFVARRGEAPVAPLYDPATGERLISEAAGCLAVLALVAFQTRRRRDTRRRRRSSAIAAERLGAVVWHDRAAQQQTRSRA